MSCFQITKTNDEQQVVFGWASVSKGINGQLLQDWQGDIIEPEDLEKAAFDFVLNFRDAGERHNPNLRKKGKLVSSIVFTEEVQKALNIPPGTVPVGWFVGFHIDDSKTWQEVKKGKYLMFSIEGQGIREPLKKGRIAKTFSEIHKYNPYHDAKGRFASRGSSKFGEKNNNAIPASMILTEKGDDFGVRAQKIKDEPGFYTIAVHGMKDGFGTKDPQSGKIVKNYTPEAFCDIIKEQKDYKKGAIKLFSCDTGADGAVAAQKVANIMGVQVKAPKGVLWLNPDGSFFVSPSIKDRTEIPEDKAWKVFMPEVL